MPLLISAWTICLLLLVGPPEAVIRPFDGTTLDKWDGDKTYWLVENGELVGRSTAEHPLPHSTYLVWTGDMPPDFELRCQVRIKGGNSGIQYRSNRVAGQADMQGFQADLDAANSYTGVLYEGLGRELMSARGEQVEWTPSGKRVLAQYAPDAVLRKAIHQDDWNEYRIEARGTRVRHWINGVLMTDVTDGDASRFRRDGALAFQLHQGAPMEVRYKDLQVRPLTTAPPVSALTVPAGFAVELLASAQQSQGSWVCIAFDPLGRAVISPQSGPLVIAWIPGQSKNNDGTPWTGTETEVRPFAAPVQGAQGLCFAGGALYADVPADGERSGLWRLRDLDSNGSYEDAAQIVKYLGDGGEHGAHGVVQGPDGALYVSVGNHARLPEAAVQYANDEHGGRAPGSPYDFFAEDFADRRMWDPRGHAVGIYAPGGVIMRVDPAGGAPTVFAGGFRNAYDLCFDERGELFTYDSDMEWDIGAPWYRAPRVVHVVQGGEYGWRSGSGCWPDYYADSLPPAVETDSASPTGMLSGHEGGFPEPWKHALFCADWTYGRILAVTPTPRGASFAAQWQPFVSGRPMPVADMAWGPDGAMYVVTGGRGTQSGLYRIRYVGAPGQAVSIPKAALAADAGAKQRALRRRFEALQRPLDDRALAEALPFLLAGLESDDRFVQFAARSALEHQPIERWRTLVADLPSDRARLAAALALARRGNDDDARAACSMAVQTIGGGGNGGPGSLETLAGLRAIEVAVARHPALRSDSTVALAPLVALAAVALDPGSDLDGVVSWTALELACGVGIGDAVPIAVALLERAPDRSTALRYATMLRNVKDGWTDELRLRYWRWLDAANDRAGGFSLAGFIQNIKKDATATVGRPVTAPAAEGAAAAATPAVPVVAVSASTSAAFHAWTVAELESGSDAAAAVAPDGSGTRDLARGARVFREATCILCHRFAGDGASTGPDLTGVGARFTRGDLLRAILEPSAIVSDQYRDSAIEVADGSLVVGRIVMDSADAVEVRTNPLTEDRERIAKRDIVKITPIETSSMPKGLLDSRSREEILDLLAYLERGGVR